mgnify:CR=1 FL=1
MLENKLNRTIKLNNDSEYSSLYSWSLEEYDSEGKKVTEAFIPMQIGTIYLDVGELEYRHNFQGSGYEPNNPKITDSEFISGTLKTQEYSQVPWQNTKNTFSMFGTNREIKTFNIIIHKVDNDSRKEESFNMSGHIGYEAEADLDVPAQKAEDALFIIVVLGEEKFNKIVQNIKDGLHPNYVSIGHAEGLYNRWTPSIHLEDIKILTDEKDFTADRSFIQQVEIPEDCDIKPPRLGKLTEFNIGFLMESTADNKNENKDNNYYDDDYGSDNPNTQESSDEWEEYFVRQKKQSKRILKTIISNNKEFQGEWQDYVTEWLGEQMLYDGDNEDFIKTEIQSERTGILILFLKMLIKDFSQKDLKSSDVTKSSEADIYFELALALADIKYLSRKSLNDDDVTREVIEEATRLTSNYSRPIETQIAGKKYSDSRMLIYLNDIDAALSIYLESEIRHSGINLLFITLYTDQEIIAFIDEAGMMSKYFKDRHPIKSLINSNFSTSLEREEKSKLRAENVGSYQYIALWIISTVIVFFIAIGLEVNGILPDAYGIGSVFPMVILYIVVSVILGFKASKKLDNPTKYFPTLTMIRNMENFYFAIRQKKQLLMLRNVKKELTLLTDAGAVMPEGIMKIIKDMDKRNKKWF